jgi:hypothetical protein
MPKHTPEEQAAKQQLTLNRFKVRKLLVAEDYKGAVEHAERFGFNVFDARLPAIYCNEAEPYFQKLEIRLGLPPQPPPPFAGQARLDAKAARAASMASDALTSAGLEAPPLPHEVEQEPAKEPEVAPEPIPVAQPAPAPVAPPEPVELIRGWPVKSPALIRNFCPNKALVIIELPDSRTASMWRGGRAWQRYDKVNVRLPADFSTGDPIYERDPTMPR